MKIAVLMSGGADSSVAAYLLKREGWEIFGIHMVHLEKPNPRVFDVARELHVDLKLVDVRDFFRREIINYFVDEYRKGRTPNPCYFCNRIVKFGLLLEKAKELGAKFIASGHYAKVMGGKLYMALDKSKDQSYFLSSLSKEVLKKVIFPLGEMKKEEVISLAKNLGIEFEEESQDVCFLKGNLSDFLKKQGVNPGKGHFILDGKVVGEHEGYAFYTIGQRKGLGVSLGRRVYTTKIDPEGNRVFLGEKRDVMYDMMIVESLNFLEDVPEAFEAVVKVRSNFRPVRAEVHINRGRAFVKFERGVFAVTPGQIAVFYDGEKVVMSGVIERGEKL